jgi:RimJ/RimL family protein N-acetyltransferase
MHMTPTATLGTDADTADLTSAVPVSACRLRAPVASDCWPLYEAVRMLDGGGLPQIRTVDDARQLLLQLATPPRTFQMVLWIVTDDSDEFRGHVILDRNLPPNHGHASVGLWIDSRWQRQGFGTQALGLALQDVARHDAWIRRIDGICVPANAAMRRVFMKCGFRSVAILPGQQLIGTRYVDMELWQYLYASPRSG